MAFIGDVEFRLSVRNDISSANNSLHNGDWKAATILAGSVAEALLLWAITNRAATIPPQNNWPNKAPEEWNLGELVDVAEQLKLIKDDTRNSDPTGQRFSKSNSSGARDPHQNSMQPRHGTCSTGRCRTCCSKLNVIKLAPLQSSRATT